MVFDFKGEAAPAWAEADFKMTKKLKFTKLHIKIKNIRYLFGE